jgi:hypothetical protein
MLALVCMYASADAHRLTRWRALVHRLRWWRARRWGRRRKRRRCWRSRRRYSGLRRRSCRRRRRCHAAATASPAATATADIVNELSLEPACVPMLLPPLESPLEPSPPPRQLPPPLALLPETTCAARRVLTRARTWTAAACTRRGLTPEVARAASFRAARGVVRRREAVRGGVSL